jgi:hypothetical protein
MLTLIVLAVAQAPQAPPLEARVAILEQMARNQEARIAKLEGVQPHVQSVAFPEPMAQPVQYAPQPTYYQAPPMQFYAPVFRPMRGGFFRRGGGSVCGPGGCN